ncbi:hypothetical protein ACRE_021380 [Hapsidospora chrysogenum ATCC 11550]|uniref:Uncharacterized protein n=1 Tax=Hapsidospora chrysogenum (strain ATCC 11550 / CBS 779.69 / DSM 880 / IAM 14645 / JCM 23072 / IMI 49137) TaxID=857340 RepID=A0A086TCK7_HAPC1|nr:hypothetical protein ACRE_021380 [Hapsidospora chrysogenum ATCC 11550]
MELEEARMRPRGCASCGPNTDTNTHGAEIEGRRTAESHASSPASSPRRPSNPDNNMISRMCGGQHQLNTDRAGRLRFFGPTSSLHLSESVVSSVLIGESYSSGRRHEWQDVLPREPQSHLFGH